MKRLLIVLIVIGLFVSYSQTAIAEPKPHDRNGFFIGFGLGGGSGGMEDVDDRKGGGVGNFRLGYAITPEVTIGLESSAWIWQEEQSGIDLMVSFSVATFGATYWPGNKGVYLKGGVGFGTVSFEESVETSLGTLKLENDDSGFGLLGAVGYEWRLTKKFALGPEVDFAYLNVGGDVGSANYVAGTLMLNWYW